MKTERLNLKIVCRYYLTILTSTWPLSKNMNYYDIHIYIFIKSSQYVPFILPCTRIFHKTNHKIIRNASVSLLYMSRSMWMPTLLTLHKLSTQITLSMPRRLTQIDTFRLLWIFCFRNYYSIPLSPWDRMCQPRLACKDCAGWSGSIHYAESIMFLLIRLIYIYKIWIKHSRDNYRRIIRLRYLPKHSRLK